MHNKSSCLRDTSCLYVVFHELRSYGRLEMMVSLKKITGDFFFHHRKSMPICSSTEGMDSKFISDLRSHIQYKCKNVNISDLKKIGGGAPVTLKSLNLPLTNNRVVSQIPGYELCLSKSQMHQCLIRVISIISFLFVLFSRFLKQHNYYHLQFTIMCFYLHQVMSEVTWVCCVE